MKSAAIVSILLSFCLAGVSIQLACVFSATDGTRAHSPPDDIRGSFTAQYGNSQTLLVFGNTVSVGDVIETSLSGSVDETIYPTLTCHYLPYPTNEWHAYSIGRQTIEVDKKYRIKMQGATSGAHPGVSAYIEILNKQWRIVKIEKAWLDRGTMSIKILPEKIEVDYVNPLGSCPACMCKDGGALDISFIVEKTSKLPMAEAGEDKRVYEGSAVQFDGTESKGSVLPTLEFFDDFEDKDRNGWYNVPVDPLFVVTGRVSIVNGNIGGAGSWVMQVEAPNDGTNKDDYAAVMYEGGGPDWTEYELELDAMIARISGGAGYAYIEVFINSQSSTDFENTYMVHMAKYQDSISILKRVKGDYWSPIDGCSYAIDQGVPYHIRVRVGDPVISLYVNGNHALTVSDQDQAFLSGTIGVGVKTAGLESVTNYFDNIQVLKWEPVPIASYEWDFDARVDSDGDGNYTNDVDATGPMPRHTYGDDGEFTVTLKVTDELGLWDIDTVNVTVLNVSPSISNVSYEMSVVNASILFRIAGEKWHNVEVHLFEDDVEIGYASITRYPGSPSDQMISLADISINFSKKYSAIAYYTPEDDSLNGQIWGATPTWFILRFDNEDRRAHHTFNVRDEDTWIWSIEDLNQHFPLPTVTLEATASDPGSDDLTFVWDWGDGTWTEHTYYNNGVGPDPFPSPEVNPVIVTDVQEHAYASAGKYTITLSIEDDDMGVVTHIIDLKI